MTTTQKLKALSKFYEVVISPDEENTITLDQSSGLRPIVAILYKMMQLRDHDPRRKK